MFYPLREVRPYIGDDQGRSGQCSEQSNLGSGTFADLFGCADLCRQTARCSFLTYWESTQECRIYKARRVQSRSKAMNS